MLDVLILAAGRGRRLQPLTDSMPKAMVRVGSKSLLEHHLTHLKAQGFSNVVINLAWLGEQIRQHLGDGKRFGLRIRYSDETHGALETGGGIVQALPLLQSDSFIVLNGDILCDFQYADLGISSPYAMHLVLVPNPPHHPDGDFSIENERLLRLDKDVNVDTDTPGVAQNWTYSGIGCFQRAIFADMKPGRYKLLPIIKRAISNNLVSAEIYHGQWLDIGSPEQLAYARQQVASD